MGIVGLPNVGKSTLFNVLTKLSIPAENFPFCTIEPNQVCSSNPPHAAQGWLNKTAAAVQSQWQQLTRCACGTFQQNQHQQLVPSTPPQGSS